MAAVRRARSVVKRLEEANLAGVHHGEDGDGRARGHLLDVLDGFLFELALNSGGLLQGQL